MTTCSESQLNHVLYLEDHLGILSVIVSHLEKYPDISVDKITSPEIAIKKISNSDYDAIITGSENPKLGKKASQSGINHITVQNRGKIVPFHLCSAITKDAIIVEDPTSCIEFSIHRRRDVRNQLAEIVSFLHTLIVRRTCYNQYEMDSWLFHDVIENSQIAIGVISDGSLTWSSRSLADLLGYSREELNGMKFASLFQDRESYTGFFKENRKNREASGWGIAPTNLVRKDRSQLHCSIRMRALDPHHPMQGHMIMVQDLTGSNHVEDQIRETIRRAKVNEARFRETLDCVNALVVRINPDGIITYANTSVKSTLGFEFDEISGKSIVGTIFPGESRFTKELQIIMSSAMADDPLTVHPIQHNAKDGSQKWVAWSAVALRSGTISADEVLLIGYDITDQNQAIPVPVKTDPWKHLVLSGTDVDEEVFDAVFHLCAEIALEGREGKHIGTSFAIGDYAAVMAHSRQCAINSYEKQDDRIRCIRHPANKEAVKGLAQMDGGFVVRGNGLIEASCRHFIIDQQEIRIPLGFGTRHSSMAGLTQMTKAIGIVVSESGGTISIFKDGKMVKRFSL